MVSGKKGIFAGRPGSPPTFVRLPGPGHDQSSAVLMTPCGEFVAALADRVHRFVPGDVDALAQMLAPMDEAGEVMAESVEFNMEPSDYLAGLEAMAGDGKDS